MKRLTTGSIIEVYVKELKLYIYMKYIDMRDFVREMSYPFQFRIYKDFFITPKPSVDDLNFSDLLISPLHLTGFKELIKVGEWKVMGNQKVTNSDTLQHKYKMT